MPFLIYVRAGGKTLYGKRHTARAIYVQPQQCIIYVSRHSRSFYAVRLKDSFEAFLTPQNGSETNARGITPPT